MASKYIKRFKIPNDFENILNDFAKEILRNQPKDIIQFGIEYFKGLETNTKVDYSNKGENRPENYKRPENQKPNIINAPNNLEISQEDKNRLQRSMDKIDRINKDPVPVENKHEEVGTQNEVERGRHVVKYEQEETHEKKVMTEEEVHVKKEVTVISKQKIIRNGEVIKDETTVKKIVSGDNENQEQLEEPEKEREPDIKQGEEGGRYGGINNEGSEQHKKGYDDWFTKHSMDKQVIDYKSEKEEELDENLKRNEMGYNTWFNNHSMGSINQSQSGEIPTEKEQIGQKEEKKPTEQKEQIEEIEHGGNKVPYSEWFTSHSKDRMVIEYKPEKGNIEENVTRSEVDYPTWFENHSKLTNKFSE